MPRAKSSVARKRYRRKILGRAKGYRGGRKLYRTAKEAVNRALAYATRDRRVRKRDLRGLWIIRLNAAARQNGLSYGRLIYGLKKAEVGLDRKSLADLAVRDEAAFSKIVDIAKAELEEKPITTA